MAQVIIRRGEAILVELAQEFGDGRRRVSAADVSDDLLATAMELGMGGLAWFWDEFPPAERFILSTIAHLTREGEVATLRQIGQALHDHGVRLQGMELSTAPMLLEEWEIEQALVHGGFSSVLALEAPAGCDGWPLTLSDPGAPFSQAALIATVNENGTEIEIGVARYAMNPDGESCEFALVVADAWQHRGIGSRLMQALMEAAAMLSREPAAMQLRDLQTLTQVAGDKSSTLVFPVPVDLIGNLLGRAKDTAPGDAG